MNIAMKETILLKQKTKKKASPSKKKRYQNMMGFFMFLIIEIRPDIVFATCVVSYFAKNLGYQLIGAVKTILQYFKSSNRQGIIYDGQNKLLVKVYSKFDQARDKKSWKLTSGFIFILNNSPVS